MDINKVSAAGINHGGPCREKAQSIVAGRVRFHERELAGWNYLQMVMAKEPPDIDEEAALWEILGRAIRETRY